MRPILKFLDDTLIEQIISEARDVLCKIGVTIHNPEIVSMLSDYGAHIYDSGHKVIFKNELIDKSLATAPSSIKLYDVMGEEAADLSGYNINYTPGSAALFIQDHGSNEFRNPDTADYVKYARLMSQLNHISLQSTAIIPADVNEKISDSYRLFLSFLYCEKPVVTGTFTIEAFEIMKNLQLAIRGDEINLKKKPLTMFSCCPTSPLKWSDVTSQNVIDCAKYSIPVEFIAMPLSGLISPVTLTGTLVQHTAETLSGVVISQLACPGAPIVYGGSPAIFDIRYETTPMGAVETQMIDCAYSEIGKYFGLPTQAYIGLSDAKQLDAQAGLESSMGATLAALSGINSISGPGMLDFESCFSLEKLVVDNEICGMTHRMIQGIEPKEDFPSLPHFEELLKDGHLLIADHTRKYLKEEIHFPGRVIERANRARWAEEGRLTLGDRANTEIKKLIDNYIPSRLSAEIKSEMENLMLSEARKNGMDKLPERG
ncbi:MAG: trimethylamine methyltransferase family protein [candidate division Zixibacteria bacterium]